MDDQNMLAVAGLADGVILFDNSDDLGYLLVGLLGRDCISGLIRCLLL
jgi:hypothetical protein